MKKLNISIIIFLTISFSTWAGLGVRGWDLEYHPDKTATICGYYGDNYDPLTWYIKIPNEVYDFNYYTRYTVTSIGTYAFYDRRGLIKIKIPNTVTSIGRSAFSICGLDSVEIPASVTSIDSSAFSFCHSLKSFTCYATTPPTIPAPPINEQRARDYLGTPFSQVDPAFAIYVPCESVEAYKSAVGWRVYDYCIKAIEGNCAATAVEETSVADAKIYVQGKQIIVAFENNPTETVQIYDLNSRVVCTSKSGDVDFTVPQSGVYVVKIGTAAKKIIIE